MSKTTEFSRMVTLGRIAGLLCLIAVLSTTLRAADQPTDHNAAVNKSITPAAKLPSVIKSYIGVTRLGTRIPCLVTKDDVDYGTKKRRILIIGGLDGSKASVDRALLLVDWFYKSDRAEPLRKKMTVSAVPIANPDDWATGRSNAKNAAQAGFPAKGPYYSTKSHPHAAYLWRWIGMHAPDQILLVSVNSAHPLIDALKKHPPAGIGMIPVTHVPVKGTAKELQRYVESILRLQALLQDQQSVLNRTVRERHRLTGKPVPKKHRFLGSPARQELLSRVARTPVQIAQQLAKKYGHDLRGVAYIPSLALIGRMRLGRLTGNASHRKDVEKIVAPYFSGQKPTFTRINGSMMPGHLVFGELAMAAKDAAKRKRYVELVKRAADLGFDADGKPKKSMPAHSEMSDAVFMGCPILVQAGKLTGERKYFDMAIRHMRFMLKLNLRKDGLHRHSPLNETAWGRGNGFPALGLSLCLTDFPKDHPKYKEMLGEFRKHMTAMAKHQDYTGTWHQVVDHPESYREFTVTCMTTFAMIRGIRNGWLDEKTYGPIVRRAWTAIKTRIAPDATLVDVCTGTGKQRSLRAYYDRTAILGHDARGGAMALMVTTEMAAWNSTKK